MEGHADYGFRRLALFGQAIMTLGAVVTALLALDDITTDNATSFVFERIALVGCGAWFALVAYGLWRQHRRALAVVSAGLLVLAGVAQPAIGPGTVPSARFEYLATVGGLVWFLLVAGILAGFAWRQTSSHAA